ncbi:MAG: hypothetical protein KY455_02905 [Euryarchaeota archaeon]|nr:hypothetical protein [Euryarchaeota archaeon]
MASAPFVRLINLQAQYGFFATMHWSLAYLFLFREGFSVYEILAVAGLLYAAAFVTLAVVRRFRYITALRWGILFRVLAIAPYAWLPDIHAIWVGSVLFGVGIVYFWVPYNVLYYSHRRPDNKAALSAVSFAVMPFVDVAVTLVAGVIVVAYGFPALFSLAVLLGVVPLVYTLRLRMPAEPPEPSPDFMGATDGLRTLMFMDGIKQGVMWPAVPLVTLFFLTGTFHFAWFFAALGLGGAVGSILIAKVSDKGKRKLTYLQPFSYFFGVMNVLSAFAGNIFAWGMTRGLATFAHTMYQPFSNAVYLDKAPSVEALYYTREVLLNAGRTLGVFILVGFVMVDRLQWALVIPGLVGLAYPVVVELKDLYPEERFILKPFRNVLRQG